MSKSPQKQPYDIARLREDIHFNEELAGHQYAFRTTWGLFSPKQIDAGTHLLIKHLPVKSDERALDLGCGYGPLGLVIAQQAPQGHCLMIDKDFVAIEYANKNAKLNNINNAKAILSNGLNEVPKQTFSLAVTNLPAKTGKEHYYLFFNDIYDRLEPGGRFYVVVISGLRQYIKRSFMEIFGNHTKVKQGKVYTVAMAEKPK